MTYFLRKGNKVFSFSQLADMKYSIQEYNHLDSVYENHPCSVWEGSNLDRVRTKWNELIEQGFRRMSV